MHNRIFRYWRFFFLFVFFSLSFLLLVFLFWGAYQSFEDGYRIWLYAQNRRLQQIWRSETSVYQTLLSSLGTQVLEDGRFEDQALWNDLHKSWLQMRHFRSSLLFSPQGIFFLDEKKGNLYVLSEEEKGDRPLQSYQSSVVLPVKDLPFRQSISFATLKNSDLSAYFYPQRRDLEPWYQEFLKSDQQTAFLNVKGGLFEAPHRNTHPFVFLHALKNDSGELIGVLGFFLLQVETFSGFVWDTFEPHFDEENFPIPRRSLIGEFAETSLDLAVINRLSGEIFWSSSDFLETWNVELRKRDLLPDNYPPYSEFHIPPAVLRELERDYSLSHDYLLGGRVYRFQLEVSGPWLWITAQRQGTFFQLFWERYPYLFYGFLIYVVFLSVLFLYLSRRALIKPLEALQTYAHLRFEEGYSHDIFPFKEGEDLRQIDHHLAHFISLFRSLDDRLVSFFVTSWELFEARRLSRVLIQARVNEILSATSSGLRNIEDLRTDGSILEAHQEELSQRFKELSNHFRILLEKLKNDFSNLHSELSEMNLKIEAKQAGILSPEDEEMLCNFFSIRLEGLSEIIESILNFLPETQDIEDAWSLSYFKLRQDVALMLHRSSLALRELTIFRNKAEELSLLDKQQISKNYEENYLLLQELASEISSSKD